jgi:hypothetical protein
MESVYPIVAIRVNETSWAHVWRLRSRYLGTGYDMPPAEVTRAWEVAIAAEAARVEAMFIVEAFAHEVAAAWESVTLVVRDEEDRSALAEREA